MPPDRRRVRSRPEGVGLRAGRAVTVVVITGTGTGVGKTVVTAALASHGLAVGIDVAVCKPVQTGAPRDNDLAEVRRLSGASELVAVAGYSEPLAPAAAAEIDGRPLPSLPEITAAVRSTDRMAGSPWSRCWRPAGGDCSRGRGPA